MLKILIVGHGFVGKAVDYGFSHPQVEKTIVDPNYGLTISDVDVASLYDEYSLCDPCPALHMTHEEASFVKYTINSFLAMKVLFFNQLYDAIGETNANFATIIKAVGMDDRIGSSHTKVPGFDGKQGYGGACFPKDTSAFTKFSDQLTLLAKCVNINNDYRLQYDLDEREIEQNVKYNGQTEEKLKDQDYGYPI